MKIQCNNKVVIEEIEFSIKLQGEKEINTFGAILTNARRGSREYTSIIDMLDKIGKTFYESIKK